MYPIEYVKHQFFICFIASTENSTRNQHTSVRSQLHQVVSTISFPVEQNNKQQLLGWPYDLVIKKKQVY